MKHDIARTKFFSRPIWLAPLIFASVWSGCDKSGSGAPTDAPGDGAKASPGDAVVYMDTTPKQKKEVDVEPIDEPGPYFVLDGQPFCFQGTNNYYLIYKSPRMMTDVLDQAKAMNLPVIRAWGYLDIGSLDGTMPSVDEGPKEGVYFQYWDPVAKRPAYNDGKDGMERLDLVLHEARKRGLKIIVVLTNNWHEFGGMDQYVTWYGGKHHHEFYTNPKIRLAFKAWIAHVIGRVNSIDGTLYRDDPAVFSWELANEPRTKNFTEFDSTEGWDASTITDWATDVSAFIKSIDPNHMVSVGDEGFLNGGRAHWAYEATDGVDHKALSSVPDIDFATFHLYPDNWGTPQSFGNDWVADHLEIAREIGKPTVLEEYGLKVRRDEDGKVIDRLDRRLLAYRNWNEIMLAKGGAASMFWILVGVDDYHGVYPDYDGYSVYHQDDDASAEVLGEYAQRFPTSARLCELAAGRDHGPASPFVRVRPVSDD